MHECPTKVTSRGRETLIVVGALAALLAIYAPIYLPYLPNGKGGLGSDYSLWLPDLLAGYFWYLKNGLWALPWYSPSQCGGIPFYADPQVPYLSVPQFLTFVMPPVEAVRTSFLLFAAAGFLGAFRLARSNFELSLPAALLAGTLFMFNNFYAARMLVGHLTYQPFMLTPVLAIAILHRPGRPKSRGGPAALGGLIVAIMIQGGAIHVVLPALLAVAILAVMQAIRCGTFTQIPLRLAGAVAIGCALCAGKLAAGAALISHFPRDQYLLPGIPGLLATCWRAAQAVFLGPPPQPETIAVNGNWALERHEWEYGVSIVPLLLMLAWFATRWAQGRRPGRPALWAAMVLLLAVPVALNWYQPGWNGVLKALPLVGNSSNLLRWFAAYILPAALGGALALDAMARGHTRWGVAAAAVAWVLISNRLTDRGFYGPGGQGAYQAFVIEASWRAAAQARTGPDITAIRLLRDQLGQVGMIPNRQDGLAFGYSQMLCYEPLFGYNLERFPRGLLRPGPALARIAGRLNVKNPACYVFPGANACAPGDPFTESQFADAQAFLDYAPFPAAKPLWARLADWLGLLTMSTLGLMGCRRLLQSKSFLVLFFKKELLPSLQYRETTKCPATEIT